MLLKSPFLDSFRSVFVDHIENRTCTGSHCTYQHVPTNFNLAPTHSPLFLLQPTNLYLLEQAQGQVCR